MDTSIPALVESYGKRFRQVLPIPDDYSDKRESLETFSKAVTSNLLGGVGYFYGNSIVNRKFSFEWDQEEDVLEDENDSEAGAKLTEPRHLLTATPSRSFFPRGFYWWVSSSSYSSKALVC